MIKSNFHTHTSFCDGKDTPSEIAERAYELGFSALGFSGHAHGDVEFYSMTNDGQKQYRREILELKDKYNGKMEIFCGLEMDLFSDEPTESFDYKIASVHYVEKNGEYLAVDESAEIEKENLEKHYGGNFEEYAEDYFKSLVKAVEKIKPDIIGHVDLLMKFCEKTDRVETQGYLETAEKYIEKLCTFDVPFEMNTGAMARGHRTTPYPSENLLGMIKKYGGKICINSDCHNKDYLDFGFDKAEELAKKCGFKSYEILTENGTKTISL